MKKESFILIFISCFSLLTACSQQGTSSTASSQERLKTASDPLTSSSISELVDQSSSVLPGQSSSATETVFSLDIPVDGTVKLSFSRIGGNTAEIVDTIEDRKTITTIIQKINGLEFTNSRFSDKEIQIKNGAATTLRIDYRDGSCKEFQGRGGWYQYSDYGEQWLEQKGSLDLEQFIADEMGVELWR